MEAPKPFLSEPDPHIERTPPESVEFEEFRRLARGLVRRLGGKSAVAAGTAGLTWSSLLGTASASSPAPVNGDYDPLLVRLVNRVCGYFEQDEYKLALDLGYEGYLDHHLNPDAIGDQELDDYIANEPGLQLLIDEDTTEKMLYQIDPSGTVPAQVMSNLTLLRRILSNKRLFERMVEFADDHFSIDIKAKSLGIMKPIDDRDVIRKEALGRFFDLLKGNMYSPAMLVYLDNFQNKEPVFQENYARELLELHTLGVDNGYDEDDVKDVAACLAGLSINLDDESPDLYKYLHVPAYHGTAQAYNILSVEPISITVGTAEEQAEEILVGLANHTNTKTFLAEKLVRWLLDYNTPSTLVDVAVDAYNDNDGRISEIVRALLAQDVLQGVVNSGSLLLKRPVQHAAGLMAQINAIVRPSQSATSPGLTVLPLGSLLDEMRRAGHTPHEWGPPNGPPQAAAPWASGVDARWRVASKILSAPQTEICDGDTGPEPCPNELPGINVENLALAQLLGVFEVSKTAERLSEVLTGGMLLQNELDAIQEYVDETVEMLIDGQIEDPFIIVRESIALTASAPSYQLY
ncbi:MAG: DUF1800 family protein [Planctomycetota bacterium]